MAKIYVPSSELKHSLEQFLRKHKIDLEFADSIEGAEIVIKMADDRKKEGDFQYLMANGSVMCSVGRSMANRLNIEKREMAKILEFLNVKTTDGQIDCF